MTHFLTHLTSVYFLGTIALATTSPPFATSGRARVHLVELYTSESCSSCPPADAWVSALQNRPGLWREFVPVVFHVDYWNQLGWKDGYSSNKMTKRQVEVSNHWTKPAVYTPAFVVDGREWQDWRSAGRSLPQASSQDIELSLYKTSDGNFKIRAVGLLAAKTYRVHATVLGMNLSRDVTAGENSGRRLTHNFVVLEWEEKSVVSQTPEAMFSFKREPKSASRLAIAAWIEEEGNPAPLQSVGAYL